MLAVWVADYLVPLLTKLSWRITGITRTERAPLPGIEWQQFDPSLDQNLVVKDLSAEAYVHLAPLPAILPLLPTIVSSGVKNLIAVGTTSILTKANSEHPADRKMVAEQRASEQRIKEFAVENEIGWSILRPTMVYDGFRDKNIAQIKRFIQRFGFSPVVMPASGKRQPLHAEDLARAIVVLLDNPAHDTINIGGGETLSYRDMLKRVFESLNKPVRTVPVPQSLLASGLSLASLFPGKGHLNSAMAARMNQDMVFDSTTAVSVLGFKPRTFQPGGKL